MNIPLPKLKAIIKFFYQNTNQNFFGKTKLMKLFYFLDFLHVKKYGISITGDTYYHLEFGPVPTTIKNLIDTVSDDPEKAILSDIIKIECEGGHDIHKIVCLLPFEKRDEEYFSQLEMETLKEVCQRFGNHSTKQIVDVSHKEASWRLTKELEAIPYSLATEDPDCIVEKEDIELLNKLLIC